MSRSGTRSRDDDGVGRPPRLVLLRHGHPAAPPGVYLGSRLDPALDGLGIEQALRAQPWIASLAAVGVVSSPLRRARETAELVAPGRDIVIEPGVREQDMGAYTGLTWEQVKGLGVEAARAWRAGAAPPGGEAAKTVWRRTIAVALDLAERLHPGEDAVLVAHSGPIRGLLASARGLEPADARRLRVRHACPRTVRLTPVVLQRWRALAASEPEVDPAAPGLAPVSGG